MDMIETDATPSAPGSNEKVTHDDPNNEEQTTYRNTSGKKKSKGKPTNLTKNVFYVNNCNGVHFGEKRTVIIETKGDRKTRKKPVGMPESVLKLTQNEEELQTETINLIKSHVGENWRDVFRALNYSDQEIDQQEYLHHLSGIAEIVYQLLLDWKRNKPDEATLGKLVSALWNSGEEDAVQQILSSK
ncbi:hypothetical protein PPYR_05462 [Photinus pyralis]|uniref:Death domain-containing protein n=1 Tax=Photinus pyralis TaxID=7054 RepID=A0A1Y1LM68_PHOPY|nr:protein immune deficiency [Photinus pyralis]XP_031335717.1 protein immune deficiency [Photinus pyralis]KAB0801108.1 hypothetical protein PPYR_05462 [Photinus pyralis]